MRVMWAESILEVIQGDITAVTADALVTAANDGLLGGGGVDGAIHRAGGPGILEECRRLGGCPIGSAVVTGAGRLPAQWVIHAVGPIWCGGSADEARLLASAYRASLIRLVDVGGRVVAFPSISTGVYGYPVQEAAFICVATVLRYLEEVSSPLHVILVQFDEATHAAYLRAAEALLAALQAVSPDAS